MAGRPTIREVKAAYLKSISEGLDEVVEAFVDESTRIIETEAVDQGTLKNSVEIRRPSKTTRVVAWTAEHAKYVHYGSRPHWPPFAPILAWVKRNVRNVILTGGGRETMIRPAGNLRAVKAPDAVLNDIAHAIQAKIAKEGTAPVPWIPRALSRVRPRTGSIMKEAVRRNLP